MYSGLVKCGGNIETCDLDQTSCELADHKRCRATLSQLDFFSSSLCRSLDWEVLCLPTFLSPQFQGWIIVRLHSGRVAGRGVAHTTAGHPPQST